MTSFFKVLILISAILLSKASASAQPNCGRFLCSSSYSILDRLSDETDSFVAKLKKSPTTLSSKGLTDQLRHIEGLNESYLNTAGIAFVRIPTTIKINGNSVEYSRYQLHGNSLGDNIAKSLLNVTVPVILDPLYLFNYKFFGHFLEQRIFVGPHVFRLNLLGATATLEHEQIHSVEQDKVHQGKMSLARIELKNSEKKRSVSYGNYVRADEIETHLNDYHLLTDPALVTQRDLNLMSQGLSASALEAIKKYRETVVKDKAQNLKRFTAESQEMLASIKTRIMHGAIPYSAKFDPISGAIRVVFTTEYKTYQYLSFDLRGLIIPADLTDWVKVREVVLQTLAWSQERIQQAQSSF